MNMKLKFGIIGYGKIGSLRKEIIEKLDIGRVIGISDPFADFTELNKSCFTSKDYHDLLNQEDINCVIIATPNNITANAVIESLEAGKHVFCEKPPGRNLAEVLKIKECHDQHPNLKLKFGFNHRVHNSVIEALRIIKSGRMGNLMWGRGVYGKSGGLNFSDQWRSDLTAAGGGILLDQGIHMVDLLNLFFGDFKEVKSFVANTYWDIPLEDNAFALLKNANNQYAVFHSSSTHWKHIFKLELFFSEGYMVLSGLLTGSRSYGRETLVIARRQFEDELEVAGNPGEEIIYFDEDRSWEIELMDFKECVCGNTKITSGTISDAVKAMELVERIYKSDHDWQEKINLQINETLL